MSFLNRVLNFLGLSWYGTKLYASYSAPTLRNSAFKNIVFIAKAREVFIKTQRVLCCVMLSYKLP
jgi:hypothetical protein